MNKPYNLPLARMKSIEVNPEEYLPVAMFTLGCHMDRLTDDDLIGLIETFASVLYSRRQSAGVVQDWLENITVTK